jgi:uncharacterized protein
LKPLFKWVWLLLLGVAMLFIALYAFQERLLFHPQQLDAGNERLLAQHAQAEQLDITNAEARANVHLRGWLLKPAPHASDRLVIYFGGNGDELSWMALHQRLPRDVNWAFVNYRGYGQSEGAPSEAAFFTDALRQYDYLTQTRGYQPQHILLMGRSLGTGVAVYLASQRPLAKLMLITPYDSITAVAQKHFAWLPVNWLLNHRFDSLALAPALRNQVTIIAAKQDKTIPPEHARRLYEAWGGDKRWQLVDADHNGIFEHAQTWRSIKEFVAE